MNSPCLNCTKRKVKCHASCNTYLEWVEGQNQRKENERAERELLTYLCDRSTRLFRYKKQRFHYRKNSK